MIAANQKSFSDLLNPLLLSELKRIELRTKRNINADLMGQYRSAFRGSGLIYTDLREYQAGDDVKHIHWKVTAKSSKTYVKSYEEDRQLNIMLMLDISKSTDFGNNKSKHQKALEFCAIIAMLAKSNQDSVGLCLFSDDIDEFIPIKNSRSQVQRVLLELLKPRLLKPATNIKIALEHVLKYLKRPTIIFLISDFYTAPFQHELKLLALKHDVVCVMLEDNMDAKLPKAGLVEFLDAESNKRIVIDTSNKKIMYELNVLYQSRINSWKEICKLADVNYLQIVDNPVRPLLQLMNLRASRLR